MKKFLKPIYGLAALIVLIILLISFGAYSRNAYEAQLAELRNQVALKDETIRTQSGAYHRLSQESTDLLKEISKKDKDLEDLLKEISKKKEDILNANKLAVKWKQAYEGLLSTKQTDVPSSGGVIRKKVEFEKDFGYIGVKGWTMTDPAEAWVRVAQNRPLKISLVMTQDSSRAWHSYATSSEENVGIDIELAAVNPYILEERWYEKIGLLANLAGGQTDSGFGILTGIGATYQIGKFELGPSIWIGISNKVDRYFGATFLWHPFQRN